MFPTLWKVSFGEIFGLVSEKSRRLERLHYELIRRRVCVNAIKILGLWATILHIRSIVNLYFFL